MRRPLSPTTRLRFEALEDRSIPATLTVSVNPSQVLESWGPLGLAGTVTRSNTDLSQPLFVDLTSSDTSELYVEAGVIIPPGQASAPFYVEVVDDGILDGTQAVQVTASAMIAGTLVEASFEYGPEAPLNHLSRSIATLPDTSFVVAGQKYVGPGSNGYNFAVSKFYPDGSPDPSFGSGGTVVTDVVTGQYDYASSVAVDQDGRILVAGYTRLPSSSRTQMAVVRYLPNGALDTTFGLGGKVVLNFGTNYSSDVWDMVLRPDGRIILAGSIDDSGPTGANFAAVQLLPNGALDTSFGVGGRATVSYTGIDRAWSVLLQPDGRVVLAGQGAGSSSQSVLMMARFHPNGSPDTSFGTGGRVTTNVPGSLETLHDVVRTTDGKYLALGKTGQVGPTSTNPHDWLLARYNANGSLDTTFSSSGYLTYEFGGDDTGRQLDFLPDGSIVAVGYGVGTISNNGRRPIVAHFDTAGQLLDHQIIDRPNSLAYDIALRGPQVLVAMNFESSPTDGFVRAYELGGSGVPITATTTVQVYDDDVGAADDSYTVYEESQLFVNSPGVLANDTGFSLSAVLVSPPANGTLTLNANGSFTYTPAPNFCGYDTFTYRAMSGGQQSNVATVTILVYPVDDPVQNHVPGPQTTAENQPITFSAANGNAISVTDIDAWDLRVQLTVLHGTVTLGTTTGVNIIAGANGTSTVTFAASTPAALNTALEGLVYTPNPAFSGSDTLTVRTDDYSYMSYGVTDIDTVEITVTAVDDPPVAVNDGTFVAEADGIFTHWGSVLSNDHDPEGQALTAELATAPAHGSMTLNADGSFTYTPTPGYRGPDSFTYRAVTATGTSEPATVTLLVNARPVAVGDAYVVDEDTTLSVGGLGILANDSDPEGSPLTTWLITPPTNGTLTLNANGSFTYVPAANFHGMDKFLYRARDQYTSSNNTWVTIHVTPVNDAPVGSADAYSVPEDGVLTVGPAAPAAADPVLRYTFDESASGSGTAADGGATPLAPGSFHGQATRTDSTPGGASLGALDLTAAGTNYVSAGDADKIDSANALTVTLWLNLRDVPHDNDRLVGDWDGGIPPAGSKGFAWTIGRQVDWSLPTADNFGLMYWSYSSDGTSAGGSATTMFGFSADQEWAFLVLTIDASGMVRMYQGDESLGVVNRGSQQYPTGPRPNPSAFRIGGLGAYGADDTPAAWIDDVRVYNRILTTAEMDAVRLQGIDEVAGGVLTNDSDIDGNPLTATLATGPQHGSVSLNPDGTFTYTPDRDFVGTDTFTYTAGDGGLPSAPTTVTITVAPRAPGVYALGDELLIVGGDSGDSVNVTPIGGEPDGSTGVAVTATLDGVSFSPSFTESFARIKVQARGGDDSTVLAETLTIAADVDAGAGNDSVTTGAGADVVTGGDGDDQVTGGAGNDFLIGGLGADLLSGLTGDDILVSGTATVVSSTDSLRQVLTAWDPTTPGIYADLRSRLVVTDDPAATDTLTGGAGTDWFWSADGLDILDQEAGEELN